jgi:TolA-binding protein
MKAPVHRVSSRNLDSIETLLRAETRISRRRAVPKPKNRKRISIAIVAVLIGSAGVAAALVQRRVAKVSQRQSVVLNVPSRSVIASPISSVNLKTVPSNDLVEVVKPSRPNDAKRTVESNSKSRKVTSVRSTFPDDTAFAIAFGQLNAGQPGVAASAFDSLLEQGTLDSSRRADVLYWSSQAYARAGNRTLAEIRARTYLNQYPNALRASDTALLLGDYARDRRQFSQARQYYERALSSGNPTSVARAKQSLEALGNK